MEKSKVTTSCELELLLEQDICELVDYENIGKEQIEGSGDIEAQGWAKLIYEIGKAIGKIVRDHGRNAYQIGRQAYRAADKWIDEAKKKNYDFDGPGGTKIFQVSDNKRNYIYFRLDYSKIHHGDGEKFLHYHQNYYTKDANKSTHYIVYPEPTQDDWKRWKAKSVKYVGPSIPLP